jgi:hypothetical protein
MMVVVGIILLLNFLPCYELIRLDSESMDPVSLDEATQANVWQNAEYGRTYGYLRIRRFGWPLPVLESRCRVYAENSQWNYYGPDNALDLIRLNGAVFGNGVADLTINLALSFLILFLLAAVLELRIHRSKGINPPLFFKTQLSTRIVFLLTCLLFVCANIKPAAIDVRPSTYSIRMYETGFLNQWYQGWPLPFATAESAHGMPLGAKRFNYSNLLFDIGIMLAGALALSAAAECYARRCSQLSPSKFKKTPTS